jgi:superfamily II DNA or RNA helicase
LEEVYLEDDETEYDHHTIDYMTDLLEDGFIPININLEDNSRKKKKATEDEQQEMDLDEGTDATKKIESLTIRRLKREFEKEDKFKPHPHQQDLLDRFKTEENWKQLNRFLLYWAMGSGKTKGVLRLLTQMPRDEVCIICSKSLIGQWVEDIKKMPQKTGSTEFRIVGYSQFSKLVHDDEYDVAGKTVIVDEAHRYKNITQKMKNDLEAMSQSSNCFLLTGTPMVNDENDINGLISTFDFQLDVDKRLSPALVQKLLKEKVSYYDPRVHNCHMVENNYPTMEVKIQYVPMTWEQTFQYVLNLKKDIEFGNIYISRSKGNSYNAQSKLLANSISDDTCDSPKFVAVVDNIVNSGVFPHVIFSHLLNRGIKPISKLLKMRRPETRQETLDGRTETGIRKKLRDKYNKSGIDALFITDASREGVDLHGTRYLHIVETCINREMESQTIGRVIRYDSHKNCDVKHVIVIKYISVFPKTIDDATLKSLEDGFVKQYKTGPLEFDFRTALFEKIKEAGMCIDEKLEKTNEEKFNRIKPYLEVIQKVGAPRWEINKKPPQPKSAPSKEKKTIPKGSGSTKGKKTSNKTTSKGSGSVKEKKTSSQTKKTSGSKQKTTDIKPTKKTGSKKTSGTKRTRTAKSEKEPVVKRSRKQ